MSELKTACEQIGFTNVLTYINSGNIIFESTIASTTKISKQLEQVLLDIFGFAVQVVTLPQKKFLAIARTLPDTWENNETSKCDVLFLWQEIDKPDILQTFTIKPDIDEVLYTPGAVLWAVDKTHIGKSGLLRIVGTETYKKMTIRNCNTVRKIATILQPV